MNISTMPYYCGQTLSSEPHWCWWQKSNDVFFIWIMYFSFHWNLKFLIRIIKVCMYILYRYGRFCSFTLCLYAKILVKQNVCSYPADPSFHLPNKQKINWNLYKYCSIHKINLLLKSIEFFSVFNDEFSYGICAQNFLYKNSTTQQHNSPNKHSKHIPYAKMN